ncbi:MAG TPA: hypothetical protein VFQ86_05150 [Arachidicoccus soli]|uniref:Conjugal transfer protein TraO n=1 Tax=Arachidicoccus soli TaxID=2341117 RepID=A0A386HTN0_9BACT|nr:hypothetical protein [Arachidicoccus soli]AYD49029.1 hypothetical protein D6B99_16250 [Arachidicoccus soli]HEU0227103.1 hypothetical protein [Arachidicoccus soli]
MKKLFPTLIITACILLFFTSRGIAQNPISDLSLSAGASTPNSKFISLSLETSSDNYSTWGAILDGIFYSNFLRKHYDWRSNDKILSLGIFYKGKLSSTKNFNSKFMLGGSGGSDNHSLIYFPFIGFEENFYLSDKLLFTVNQKVLYLSGYKDMEHWQPSLNLGFKVIL